jgi:hypothetical protein
MTLMKLRKKLASRRTTQTILWTLIAVFLVGIALWSVPSRGLNTGGGPRRNAGGFFGGGKALATINGKPFTDVMLESEYNAQVAKLSEQQPPQPPPDYNTAPQMRSKIFIDAIRKAVIDQTLRKQHVNVTYFTLRDMAKEYADQQITGTNKSVNERVEQEKKAAKTPEARTKLKTKEVLLSEEYKSVMSQSGADVTSMGTVTDAKFRNWFIDDFLLNKGPKGLYDRFNDHARIRKIGQVYAKQTLPIDPFTKSYAEKLYTKDVQASWIFFAAKANTEEAMKAAEKLANDTRAAIEKNPKIFEEKAKQLSDDNQTKMFNGKLGNPPGWVTAPGQAPVIAEYLAYTTEPGKISPVMSTYLTTYFSSRAGYAIVKVDKIRDHKPVNEDWAKHPDQAMVTLRQRYEVDLGETNLFVERSKAKVEVFSNELRVYQAEDGAEFPKADEYRKAAYEEYLKDNTKLPAEVAAGFAYKLAPAEPDLLKRAKLMEAAANYISAEEAPKLLADIGNLYARQSIVLKRTNAAESKVNYDKAMGYYTSALSSMPDTEWRVRDQIRTDYRVLGYTKGVDELNAWFKAHPEVGAPPGLGGMPPAAPAR